MKRILSAALALLLLLLLALQAGAAEDGIAAVSLADDGDGNFVLTEEREARPFWEAPTFTAGQSRAGGTLTLRNRTNREAEIWLEEIGLPYGNREALVYLNALRLTLRHGSTVYYDAPYAKIAEGGLPDVRFKLAPGETVSLTVDVTCGFKWEGDKPAFDSIGWRFGGKLGEVSVTMPHFRTKDAPWKIALWVGCGVLGVGVLAGAFMLLGRRKPRGQSAVIEDTENPD